MKSLICAEGGVREGCSIPITAFFNITFNISLFHFNSLHSTGGGRQLPDTLIFFICKCKKNFVCCEKKWGAGPSLILCAWWSGLNLQKKSRGRAPPPPLAPSAVPTPMYPIVVRYSLAHKCSYMLRGEGIRTSCTIQINCLKTYAGT